MNRIDQARGGHEPFASFKVRKFCHSEFLRSDQNCTLERCLSLYWSGKEGTHAVGRVRRREWRQRVYTDHVRFKMFCKRADFVMRGSAISAVTRDRVASEDSFCDFRKAAFHAARFSGEFTEREKSMM